MKIKRSWLVILFVSLVLGYATAQSIEAATELARINNTVITLEDFNKKFRENLKFFQSKVPSRSGVLDDLIKRELGVQEAKRLGLDKDPDVIDRMNTVLYHALLDKKLSKEFEGIFISDDEAKNFYAKNPEVRTSHIFVALAPDANAEDDKKAYEKIKRILDDHVRDNASKEKISFAEVAQRFSEGANASMGGDMDYQTRDKLDPAYYEAAVSLRTIGKVSGIVRSQFGYHLIRLTGLKKWEDTDKAQAKRLLFEDKRKDIFERYMAQLRKQAKVVIKADLIKDK